jgi:CO/xanthine dehydrogenase FAD-binding subunit
VGGNTDVQLQRRQGLIAPKVLVSLGDVADMRGIERRPDGAWRIGAAVTLLELADAFPMMAPCIDTIATPQIRRAATVGGNLLQAKRCWFFRNDFPCFKRRGGLAPCYAIEGDHRFYHAAIDGHRCQAVTPSDLATLFLALDADVVTSGRTMTLAALYTGPGETTLRPDELLTHVDIPAASLGRVLAFEKLALWQGDFASASVALSVDVKPGGAWHDIRLVLGAVAPVPIRATATERALEGRRITPLMLHQALDRELAAIAHPLKNNGWKLEAVAGLAEIAAERIAEAP